MISIMKCSKMRTNISDIYIYYLLFTYLSYLSKHLIIYAECNILHEDKNKTCYITISDITDITWE